MAYFGCLKMRQKGAPTESLGMPFQKEDEAQHPLETVGEFFVFLSPFFLYRLSFVRQT